jgi:TetR/AcrR family transcriptional repressor of nem operon
MRYDAEHKERTRQRVLSEAATAIREHGPAGISVADLMAKAGLTHGGFYVHFKSKNALIAESISEMFDERHQFFISLIQDFGPAEGFGRYIDSYLSRRHRDSPSQGCPVPALSGDLARMPSLARKSFEAGVERLIDAMADVLKKLDQPHPKALATSLLSEMVGAMAMSRAVSNASLSDAILKGARDNLKARIGTARVELR